MAGYSAFVAEYPVFLHIVNRQLSGNDIDSSSGICYNTINIIIQKEWVL